MLFEFIATITVGLGSAGLILGLQKITRGALPKWVMPATAGLGMLLFTIWTEYSWFERATEALGPEKIVVRTVEKKQVWRPWTYARPVTTRFIALDSAAAQTVGAHVLTDMYLVSRRSDNAIVPVAFDCLLGRQSPLFDREAPDVEARLETAEWGQLEQEDRLLRTACDGLR